MHITKTSEGTKLTLALEGRLDTTTAPQLEVEVKVVSTGVVRKIIIKGQENQMTEEEIAKRMEELAYLKIQPRDYEENRLVLTNAICRR